MINFNITAANEYPNWDIDTEKLIKSTEEIFKFYLGCGEIMEKFCLKDFDYDTVAFDFLFTDKQTTHKINLEYRGKDYPADIITFAIFADSQDDERFVQDYEINLGEVIIALDKVIESANKKGISKEIELLFLISHGIMHLLGFDHQSEDDFEFVVGYQKKALESIGIKYDKI